MVAKRIIVTLFALITMIMMASGSAAGADLYSWKKASPETQHYILTLARKAFDTYVLNHEVIDCPKDLPPLLRERGGVFVSTMDSKGAPRCCMGTLYPMEADIAHEIIANAVTAAGRDRRFRPIKPNELIKLRLIVSIIGRPTPINESDIKRLDPVQHGLVVKNGSQYGVMLTGETDKIELMLKWGRIRANANANSRVEYFIIDDVRFMEEHRQRVVL